MPEGDRRGRPSLSVVVTDQRGRRLRDPGVARWLQEVAPRGASGTVAVALVPDSTIRQLNARFAGKDRVTDVLSFPAGRPAAPTPAPGREGGRHLGDVVIAKGVAGRQAREAGHSLRTELRVLALHGLLHLLGYDHHRDGGAMAGVERRLRRRGGLRDGLIERSSAGDGARLDHV